MKESTLKKNAAARIRQRGGWAKSIAAGPASAGLPDLIFWYRGYGGGLEAKLPGKEHTLTKLQAETLAGMKAGGAIALMFTTVKQVEKILDAIDEKKDGRRARQA